MCGCVGVRVGVWVCTFQCMCECLVHKHAYECVSMQKMCRCHGTILLNTKYGNSSEKAQSAKVHEKQLNFTS